MLFVDDKQGWAVGALGTILTTNDGGRSWQASHVWMGCSKTASLALENFYRPVRSVGISFTETYCIRMCWLRNTMRRV